MVVRHWVDGVFPLILDVEAKAAERVHECVWEQLFGNIVRLGIKSNHDSVSHPLEGGGS